jgi:succinyl-diaminopimelate desuccinylase
VFQSAARAVAATGRVSAIRQWKFGTDGGHSCGTHGVPTIGFAPGLEELAHTSREHLDLASAREAFDAYPVVVRAVQPALAAARPIPLTALPSLPAAVAA